jgi:putative hydrolase of the HAD superfamily
VERRTVRPGKLNAACEQTQVVMFIFFDIDATLVDHEKAAEIAASKFLRHFADLLPYSHEPEFLKAWHEVSDRHNDLYFRGEVSLIEQRRNRMRELFANAEPPLSNEEADARFQVYLEHYESNWNLFDDVLPCLDSLAHIPHGLISNGDLEQQLRKLKQTNLDGRFSTVIVSSEIGVSKPKPEIFLEACRRAEVSPKACIYVGDRLDVDVLPSRAIGMKGVWLNRKKLPMPNSGIPVITTLYDLERCLAGLECQR